MFSFYNVVLKMAIIFTLLSLCLLMSKIRLDIKQSLYYVQRWNFEKHAPEVRACYKGYFSHRDCLESQQMVGLWTFRRSGNYSKTSDDHLGLDITLRTPAGIHPLFSTTMEISLSASEFCKWKELEGPLLVRDWWKKFTSLGRSQALGGKISPIKDGDPHRNKNLSVTSQKGLIVNK